MDSDSSDILSKSHFCNNHILTNTSNNIQIKYSYLYEIFLPKFKLDYMRISWKRGLIGKNMRDRI